MLWIVVATICWLTPGSDSRECLALASQVGAKSERACYRDLAPMLMTEILSDPSMRIPLSLHQGTIEIRCMATQGA